MNFYQIDLHFVLFQRHDPHLSVTYLFLLKIGHWQMENKKETSVDNGNERKMVNVCLNNQCFIGGW